MYLRHHGVKGQQWGVRRGPPYPLVKKSLTKKNSNSYTERVQKGKAAVERILGRHGNKPFLVGSLSFKKVNEPVSESLKKVNPLHDSLEGDNNCSCCVVAGHLRQAGFDVTAKGTSGKPQNLAGVVEECFNGAKVYDGSAKRFAQSPNDAAAMLKKRFGDNADGAVGITWKGGASGHTFNWKIENGNVQFLDYQNGWDDNFVRKTFWKNIDPEGNLQFVRLDGLEPDVNALKKYVDTK